MLENGGNKFFWVAGWIENELLRGRYRDKKMNEMGERRDEELERRIKGVSLE